jgi:hypothetical protein
LLVEMFFRWSKPPRDVCENRAKLITALPVAVMREETKVRIVKEEYDGCDELEVTGSKGQVFHGYAKRNS